MLAVFFLIIFYYSHQICRGPLNNLNVELWHCTYKLLDWALKGPGISSSCRGTRAEWRMQWRRGGGGDTGTQIREPAGGSAQLRRVGCSPMVHDNNSAHSRWRQTQSNYYIHRSSDRNLIVKFSSPLKMKVANSMDPFFAASKARAALEVVLKRTKKYRYLILPLPNLTELHSRKW